MSHAPSSVPARPLVVRQLLVAPPAAGAARNWFGGDAFRTQMFNAMSLMFPDGERYFVDSVRPYLAHLRSPELHAAARQFIGQESTHRHQHARFNAWLGQQGVRDVVSPMIRWRIRVTARMADRHKLALTVAMEHLTAVMADALLRKPRWHQAMAAPIGTLWGWHAVEEIEHKAVAFDVYRAIGGGGPHRLFWFAYACAVFGIDLAVQLGYSLHRDGTLWRASTWRSGASFLFGSDGLLWHAAPRCLAYLRKGFHPWQERNGELVECWLQSHAADFRELARVESLE